MPRKLSRESEEDLERLRRFLEIFMAALVERHGYLPNAPELYHESSEAIERKAGRAALLRGTRMAVGDMLQTSKELSAEEGAELNALLIKAGAPTITELRRRFWKEIPKIIQCGRIRSETEYYLLVEELNDTSSDLREAERATAGRLVAAFEENHRPV